MREHGDTLAAELLELANRQHGILRRDDLLRMGLTRSGISRWVTACRLTRLHREVYALGHTALRPEARWLAAVWACGDGAVLSHLSAAAYHGLRDEGSDEPIHVSTTRSVKTRTGLVVHRVRSLPGVDVFRADPLRVTHAPRTVIDIADELEWPQFRAVVDCLPELHLARIRNAQQRAPGRQGAGLVARLIESADAHTKSEFERRYLRFAARVDLASPDRLNCKIAGQKADCVYDDARVVIELDGRAHHRRAGQMRKDRQRDRRYQAHGYVILRLVWDDLHPEEAQRTAAELRQMLGRVP